MARGGESGDEIGSWPIGDPTLSIPPAFVTTNRLLSEQFLQTSLAGVQIDTIATTSPQTQQIPALGARAGIHPYSDLLQTHTVCLFKCLFTCLFI